MSTKPKKRTKYTYTEDDWSQMRAHFMGSILADVHLHKLAKNMGASWPAKGSDETPSKYLEYSFDELAKAPGLEGQPSRLQLLFDILKETLSFDDPFQDMIEGKPDSGKPSSNNNQLLEKLGVSPDFPLDFTALSDDTKELCRAEDALTIGQCVALFQKMAQSIILGGEIRHLLNSLAHSDSRALATLLPLRAGTRGLHLAEAVGIAIRTLPEDQRDACLAPSSANQAAQALAQDELLARLNALFEWFSGEAEKLRELAATGQPLDRFFHPLNDPAVEKTAARAAARYFGSGASASAVAPAEEGNQTPTGLMGRLTGFFRSSD